MGADAPREVLQRRLTELLQREAAVSRHLRGEDGRNEADFSDIANYTASDEVLEGLEDSALAEIRQIQAALERVEAGTYGVCASCGEDIAPKRLEALPSTLHCLECAARLSP